jgi:hypothetical protein
VDYTLLYEGGARTSIPNGLGALYSDWSLIYFILMRYVHFDEILEVNSYVKEVCVAE